MQGLLLRVCDEIMIPVVVKNSKVPGIMSIIIDVYAITLWPFIFFRDDGNDITLQHESIHIKQQTELLVLFFYILYVWDWIVGMIKYRDGAVSYRMIRFEQEAYENEHDPAYLDNRQPYAWRKYRVWSDK